MTSVNKAIIVGNLSANSETRYISNGNTVINIRVATTDRYKDKVSGEMKETTRWHRVAFFSRLAGIVGEYLKKGSQVYVENRLRTHQWEKDSRKQYSTEIIVDQLQILSKVSGDRGTAGANDFESEGKVPL